MVAGIKSMVAVAVLCVGIGWAQTAPPLAIVDETLPSLDAGAEVRIPLHASGGVPPYHWSVVEGDLPAGISLTPEGLLTGTPGKAGTFSFTVAVEDSAKPANTIRKQFRAQVPASLEFDWLRPPQVRGNSMEGVAQVSNGTKTDFDLTVIVVAVNEVGRATALGYQHLMLKAGSVNFQVPFVSILPRGAYVVHADAVAEIPAKNTILRRQLETPAPLPVTQGP